MEIELCDDPACIGCRTVEYIDNLGEQGLSPGEIITAFAAGLDRLFDIKMSFIDMPAEFADDRPNDEVIH